MTIHSFLQTLTIGLIAGFLFGYFFREFLTWAVTFLHTHTEPSHLRRYHVSKDTENLNQPSIKD